MLLRVLVRRCAELVGMELLRRALPFACEIVVVRAGGRSLALVVISACRPLRTAWEVLSDLLSAPRPISRRFEGEEQGNVRAEKPVAPARASGPSPLPT